MKRLLSLLLLLCLLCTAAAAEPCSHARTTDELYTCVVPECEPMEDNWFKDSLMIGDSITASLDSREVLPGLQIEYFIGLSPNAALKHNNMTWKGSSCTMVQLAINAQPRRLFVMLGSNGLDRMKSGTILDDYHDMLDALLDGLLDTEIYLIAVTPIRSPATKEKYPTFTHARIKAFNKGLLELAQEHGVYYIDCYTPLLTANQRDGDRANFTGDGIHLTKQGAEKVAHTIRTHVVPMKIILEEVVLD